MKILRAVGVAAVWVGVVGLGVVQGQTAPKRPMTFQDLMAMKRVSDPQTSPSGKWVMFSVTDVSLEKNTKVNHLWVVALGGSGSAEGQKQIPSGNDKQKDGGAERQITFRGGESFGRFSPDGRWVSLTMKDQIFEMPWDETKGTVGEAVQVTNVEGVADGAVWSPDSRRLMFVASVWPECSVKGGTVPGDGLGQKQIPSGNDKQKGDDASLPGAGTPVFVVGGTRDVSAWKGAEAASWAEEDACDKAKDAAADKSPVKGQVWDGLLYRHWEHLTGAKRSHILVVNADGSGTRDLTPASAVGDAETPTFFVGGAQNYAWAPDGKEIAYVTNLDAVPAASTNNDVFTLRLDEPGAKAVKVSTSPGSDDGPAYSPDGKWLAFRSQARGGFESDKFRLMVFDREKKTIKDLMPKFDRWVDEFVWSPPPATILAAALRTGKGVGPQLAQHIYVISGSEGEEALYRVTLSDSTDIRRLTNRGELSSVTISPDGLMAVVAGMTVDRPTELLAVDELNLMCASNDGEWPAGTAANANACSSDAFREKGQFTHLNDALLSGIETGDMESFWFTGAVGTKVQGFIMRPPGFDPAKKYPVKFLMHGGPQTAWGDAWSFRWNWELMAANGYVVVGINRRGSTGYGQKFVDEVSGDWGGRAYEDLMKGLDYAETKYPFVDKTRECALGASYGGFMADWVLTHTNRFKCIVTHDGMYDPVAAYGTTEELWFNEWEFRRPEDFPKGWDGFSGGYDPLGHANPTHAQGARVNGAPASSQKQIPFGNDKQDSGRPAQPWRYAGLAADQDPFRKWAPVRFIQNAKTPTLVIHSQKDYRLDVSQGFELFTALQRLGVPSKMLYFPDESHWVLKPQDSQVWNEVVADWCDRWTKTGKYAESQ